MLGELALEASADDIEALDNSILAFRVERPSAVEYVATRAGLREAAMLR
jgi:hypothetical protein